jgi:hypothetical protein
METIDFTIENDNENYLIKFQCGNVYELNIWLKKDELNLLKNIKNADWLNRDSIKAGVSSNASVFWGYDDKDKIVSILVGDDPETWDFGVFVPLKTIEKLLVELFIE